MGGSGHKNGTDTDLHNSQDDLVLLFADFPVFPVFLQNGIGMYGKNTDRCDRGHCNLSMLLRYLNYTAELGLGLHYKMEETYYRGAVINNYSGTFAYRTVVCSKSGLNCAIVLQLNNQPDSSVRFSTAASKWKAEKSFYWLAVQLSRIPDASRPIIINVHRLSLRSYIRIADMLRKMYLNYTAELGLGLHYKMEETYYRGAVINNYSGTFAYRTVICSKSGLNCAVVLQLNNQPDSSVRFSTEASKWKAEKSFYWLAVQLSRISDASRPIIINVHRLSLRSYIRIADMLRKM
ncbi:unnamed protein product [Gongylonema pulchrum]|uniref:Uncharacterized protein n=1 Tax=Gongylonema pulchrum TaxID=637853 RepID=A0A3P7MUG2_9BILA|nr:unnamed protein product [Gongylonema pulchrum]